MKQNKKKSEPVPILFNMEGLKKKMKEYVSTMKPSKVKDEAAQTLSSFLRWVEDDGGLLNIYEVSHDGKGSGIVMAYTPEDAKVVWDSAGLSYAKIKSVRLLGEASKGQERGMVTFDCGDYH